MTRTEAISQPRPDQQLIKEMGEEIVRLRAATPAPSEDRLRTALHVDCQPTQPCRLPHGYEDRVLAALSPESSR